MPLTLLIIAEFPLFENTFLSLLKVFANDVKHVINIKLFISTGYRHNTVAGGRSLHGN